MQYFLPSMPVPNTLTVIRGTKPARVVLSVLPPDHAYTSEQLAVARHCYRAILREASYLPDPWSRQYVKLCAQHRFRKAPPRYPAKARPAELQLGYVVADTRKHVRQLVKANKGETGALEKIMRLAFGRTGKRRHELLSPLLGGCEYRDVQKPPTLSKAMHALLISQVVNKPPTTGRSNPRSLKATVPDYNELNAWSHPVSERRAIRKAKVALYDMFDRVQVPPPEDQWNFLHKIIVEGGTVPAVPEYRVRTKPMGDETEHEIEDHVDGESAIIAAGKQLVLLSRILLGKQPEKQVASAEYVFERLRRHRCPETWYYSGVKYNNNPRSLTITPRLMRRRYQAVFAQCPRIQYDTNNDKWIVQWGHKLIEEAVWRRVAKEHDIQAYNGHAG
ncbi:hypothetical protein BDZ85DRAFT_14142 [Elsinoe ampelina]|uniref:LYR motif-containing protein Cup1-like N-terminal domain-containing protein n=1 Tax=Elsinoe ampelina TaxID=302913 RepID=A0A6A6GRB2_9PEZI|nr:hypothetical protein BDZ85DRAFT_14142 [Elsinoe ampelina]